MSTSYTSSSTYSVVDIESVMRRVKADFVMIAASTGAITEQKALDWAHDVEVLARNGYLHTVDLTLLSYGIEQKATRFIVNTESGELTMSRPGGVMWPKVLGADLRIVLFYTSAYDSAAREKMSSKLNITWVPTAADTTHSSLKSSSGRDYASNGYGIQRKDYSV